MRESICRHSLPCLCTLKHPFIFAFIGIWSNITFLQKKAVLENEMMLTTDIQTIEVRPKKIHRSLLTRFQVILNPNPVQVDLHKNNRADKSNQYANYFRLHFKVILDSRCGNMCCYDCRYVLFFQYPIKILIIKNCVSFTFYSLFGIDYDIEYQKSLHECS